MTTKINKSHLLLLKMIEKNGNRNCADCGVEGTRWASWNFGIFLCIRCAGIHRNLGVHISKVKSVDLDSWTTEQLQVMETMGNQRSQEIFEAALPQNFARPQTNYAIEEFIRAKYQYKRYCLDTNKSETISTPKPTPVNPPDTKQRSNKTINNTEIDLIEQQSKAMDSDDSLSDPDYLIELKDKQKNKSSNKINPEINLINFNSSGLPNNDSHRIDYGANSNKVDQKSNILALYNQPNSNGGYQSGFTHSIDSYSSHHKSYGSSVNNQYNTTTSIPVSNQNSYLKQIQDKLTNLKDNLTSKFRPYEQTNSSPYQSNVSFNRNNSNISTGDTANQNGGHTLSPDLWR